jgi:hypothetical protein
VSIDSIDAPAVLEPLAAQEAARERPEDMGPAGRAGATGRARGTG